MKLDPECKDFIEVPMTKHLKMSFLNGHNGLRNRIAMTLNISNMIQVVGDLFDLFKPNKALVASLSIHFYYRILLYLNLNPWFSI